ncbi:hypothetical protein Indivirus_2_90 [Indivirus ILV1]|uniref:Uncharacterized protein n=1 Tax=Indivirus ILV1 TaxID=1977633 RepID=A0A1V0SDE6_9VIRU|nr:hypothetical protein Indivirus_2_90 [Indivirus ILV1]
MLNNNDEFISVHDIGSIKQLIKNENSIPVFQVQGKNDTSFAIIMKVGYLENPHDVLINEFKLLDKYKCYIVSRLFCQSELDMLKENKIHQMIKIIICRLGDDMNIPLSYLCFNFNAYEIPENYISTQENKIELNGQYTITFHFQKDSQNKYKILRSYEKFMGKDAMLNKLVKCLFDENVLNELEK